MKTVDDLISEWTEEEREKLKDLIEECRERELQLMKYSASCQENLTQLTDSLSFLLLNRYSIRKKTPKLEDMLLVTYLNWDHKKFPPS
jgi:hypothetical protein